MSNSVHSVKPFQAMSSPLCVRVSLYLFGVGSCLGVWKIYEFQSLSSFVVDLRLPCVPGLGNSW